MTTKVQAVRKPITLRLAAQGRTERCVIKIPPALMREFDHVVLDLGYASRSQALIELILAALEKRTPEGFGSTSHEYPHDTHSATTRSTT